MKQIVFTLFLIQSFNLFADCAMQGLYSAKEKYLLFGSQSVELSDTYPLECQPGNRHPNANIQDQLIEARNKLKNLNLTYVKAKSALNELKRSCGNDDSTTKNVRRRAQYYLSKLKKEHQDFYQGKHSIYSKYIDCFNYYGVSPTAFIDI
ncbi:MAG: hypothetical protein H6622_11535 [Halobacteriovoraceae bacterium]|nr:hypothetical protein [Halobacteriovoraceae bacterium]